MKGGARGPKRSRLKDILIRGPSAAEKCTYDAARFLAEVVQTAAEAPLPPFTTIASLARPAIGTVAIVQVSSSLEAFMLLGISS